MTKPTHKLRALGNVADIISASPSVSAAARTLGVNRSTIHRWIAAGKVPAPGAGGQTGKTVQSATLDDPPSIADYLAPRPGRYNAVADRRWLAARAHIGRVSVGTPHDIRHLLTLSGAALTKWEHERAEWIEQQFKARAGGVCLAETD
jgi:hypothetical protein